MNRLIIGFDLETSSQAALISVGAYRYLADPSTRALMFAYQPIGAIAGPKLWIEGDPIPADFAAYVRDGALFSGWNVLLFDRVGYQTLLVERWGFPAIPNDNWIDTMHRAAMANLPRSLDGCAAAINMPFQATLKDQARIKRVTDAKRTPIPYLVADILEQRMQFTKTKAQADTLCAAGEAAVSISLLEDMQWLAERCVQDVELESGIMQRLPDWPAIAPWLSMPAIDRKINDRGILLDVSMAEGLIRAATAETHRLNEQMNALTRGRVSHATKIEALKQWLVQDRGIALPSTEDVKKSQNEDDDNPEVEEEEEKTKSQKSEWKLRKSDIADLIANEATPEDCREALKIRAEVSKVSTRKFTTMLSQASFDGRLRGSMRLGGAQQTMRFASPGANLYNTVRDVFGNSDEVAEAHGLSVKADYVEVQRRQEQWLREAIEVARAGDHELIRLRYSRQRKDAQGRVQDLGVLTWISRMTRRTLAARQHELLLNGDYAQIEARVTAWLAQQTNIIEAYATKQDVYKIAASGIYGAAIEDLTKTMRQAGKVATLACGYGGGINALLAMGYNYGLLMTEEEAAPIVKAYRESNREVQRYWYALDDAAANAVRRPGKRFPVPPLELVSYFMDPSGADCLCCELPSGRWLRYWQPRLRQEYWDEERTQPKQRMSLSGLTMKGKMWFPRSLYHTILAENISQAIATADMLCHGLDNCDRNGIPVILHVYDSIAAEVTADQAEVIKPVFEQCMLDQPGWTYGLPIGCDIEVSTRFG